MTRLQIAEMVQGFGLPSTYYAYPNDQAPALPYVIYYYPDRDDVMADNMNYVKVATLRIELYTETKDFTTEETIENSLPFPYSKDVEYLDCEKMYQITYESEVIING